MTSMAIGAQCHPNITTIQARSALHPPGEAGPNQEKVLEEEEEEERAIASMALYTASAHAPSSMVRLGPGAHGGPARYIGVMNTIHLYLALEAWCNIKDIPKPSFHTLLHALEKCGCVRFRTTAGQHPDCGTCVHFKRLPRAPQEKLDNNAHWCWRTIAST